VKNSKFTRLANSWPKVCAPISKSGFCAMLMSERPYGGWLLILNMVVCGVGGVQMRSMGHMMWDFGKI
jgi:hypothetical protein